MVQETLRLPPPLSLQLDALAAALEVSRAQILRLVITAGVPAVQRRADAYQVHVKGVTP